MAEVERTKPHGGGEAPHGISWSEVRARVAGPAPPTHGCPVLDLRSSDAPPTDHLPGSAWAPAPAGGSPAASLLPTRGQEFVVMAATPDRARARAEDLRQRGWRADYLAEAADPAAFVPGPPRGALWTPDPYLRSMVDRLELGGDGRVLDLGCGNGRDAVFLAQAGARVLGVDRLPDALDLARERAAVHGQALEWLAARITAIDDLPPELFAGVVCVRLWLPAVVHRLHERVRPGGFCLVRTFAPGPLTRGGPRREAHRVSREELRRRLAENWDFVDGPVELDADPGPWVQVLARRRLRAG